jgi:uncharacterized YigZ family protein
MSEDTYLTITNQVGQGTYTEKRSKFLAFAHHVKTVDEAMAIVSGYRQKYYDARHCCYAYMIGADKSIFRANDDGEPSSTAGKPILGQINSRGLTDILVVVVRYYGGVNLGTGGLIVAYRTAAAEALDHAQVEEKTIEKIVKFEFTYPMISAVMKVANDMNARIVSQKFDNACEIELAIPQSKAEELSRRLDLLNF